MVISVSEVSFFYRCADAHVEIKTVEVDNSPFCFSQKQSNVTLGPGLPQLTTGWGSQKIQYKTPLCYLLWN